MNIPVAHLHGGERSGTIDESVRHAISKLSHFHLAATEDAAERLRRMGEQVERIRVVGAPGLPEISFDSTFRADHLVARFGFPPGSRVALVAFHPVVQEAELASGQIAAILEAVRLEGFVQVIFRPNSDAGAGAIDAVLASWTNAPDARILTHLSRSEYLNALFSADLLIGNSSSGIIESASVRTPCVNVGTRQRHRESNSNTIHCDIVETQAIRRAICAALELQLDGSNVYGNGRTYEHLLEFLDDLDFPPEVLHKEMTY